MSFCEKCGAQLEKTSVYCPNCGSGIQTKEIKPKKGSGNKINLILSILAILFLASLILNIIFLNNNDWHLKKRIYWQGIPYAVTQSFFDEKLSQSRQEGHDAGYSEGYTVGEKAGYDKGYSAGSSEGYNQGYNKGYGLGLNVGAQECQGYISANQEAICASSQQDLGSSLFPMLLELFLSAIL